jgi:hypothetical protein
MDAKRRRAKAADPFARRPRAVARAFASDPTRHPGREAREGWGASARTVALRKAACRRLSARAPRVFTSVNLAARA